MLRPKLRRPALCSGVIAEQRLRQRAAKGIEPRADQCRLNFGKPSLADGTLAEKIHSLYRVIPTCVKADSFQGFQNEAASHAHRPPRLRQCMTLSAGWY